MQDESNPFEAPTSRPAIPRPFTWPARSRVARRRRLIGWLVIFVLNLPFAVYFGAGMGGPEVWLGMTLAVIVLGGFGAWYCLSSARRGMAMIVGGGFVASSQVIPALQVFAGLFGVGLAQGLGFVVGAHPGGGPLLSGIGGGFVASMVSGSLLMFAALVVGLIVNHLLPDRWLVIGEPDDES